MAVKVGERRSKAGAKGEGEDWKEVQMSSPLPLALNKMEEKMKVTDVELKELMDLYHTARNRRVGRWLCKNCIRIGGD